MNATEESSTDLWPICYKLRSETGSAFSTLEENKNKNKNKQSPKSLDWHFRSSRFGFDLSLKTYFLSFTFKI